MNLFTIASLPFAKQDEAWRQHMKAMREELDLMTEAVTASIATASTNLAQSAAELAASRALKRIQDEVRAKAEANQKSDWSVWRNNPAPARVEAGGSKIDLEGGTLTLSDGTRIDLKTGLKITTSITV